MEIKSNLQKLIKKNIYGISQSIRITFPAGLGSAAFSEAQSILTNPWFAQKFTPECLLEKNEIRIENIHFSIITELLLRNQCFSDVRLVLYAGKAFDKSGFKNKCAAIDWEYYLNKQMSVRIKTKSIASKAFHETGLKEILSEILTEKVLEIVTGDENEATTTVHADLYKDKLTLSISLAGQPLYQRGYRGKFGASAPLREDAAAACLKNALSFAKSIHENFSPDTLLIPFSGTGTFAFEYLQSLLNFSPALFMRKYALQAMPLFHAENFQYLLKKAKEHYVQPQEIFQIISIDSSGNANQAMMENWENFKKLILANDLVLPDELIIHKNYQQDFNEMDFAQVIPTATKNLFIPLNPPYGVRLNKSVDMTEFYQKIAAKLNEISKMTKKNLAGFVLCPSEETWSGFSRHLKNAVTSTYHFTQGGLDIRVCQFVI